MNNCFTAFNHPFPRELSYACGKQKRPHLHHSYYWVTNLKKKDESIWNINLGTERHHLKNFVYITDDSRFSQRIQGLQIAGAFIFSVFIARSESVLPLFSCERNQPIKTITNRLVPTVVSHSVVSYPGRAIRAQSVDSFHTHTNKVCFFMLSILQ